MSSRNRRASPVRSSYRRESPPPARTSRRVSRSRSRDGRRRRDDDSYRRSPPRRSPSYRRSPVASSRPYKRWREDEIEPAKEWWKTEDKKPKRDISYKEKSAVVAKDDYYAREKIVEAKKPDRYVESSRQPTVASKETAPTSSYPGSSTVWIGSVPEGSTEEDIYDVMTKFGQVEGLRLVASRGFGYIRFSDEKTALKVVAQSVLVNNKRVRMDMCESMPQLGHPYRPAANTRPSSCSTLFVGNLPEDVTEDEIRNFFNSKYPQLEVVSVSMRRSGHRGFAFAHVKFDSPEACEKAAEAAGGRLRGNRLRLDWAVDKGERQGASTNVASSSTVSVAPATTSGPGSYSSHITNELRGTTPRLYVGGLSDSTSEETVRAHFYEAVGSHAVTFVRLHKDRSGMKTFAYVTFASNEAAAEALDKTLNTSINGARIRVDFARQDRIQASGAGNQPTSAPQQNSEIQRSQSPTPLNAKRVTPVSYATPPEYMGMRTWAQSYPNLVRSSVSA